MITNFKLFIESSFANVEVSPNNASGPIGDTSSTRDQGGYMVSGNDGNYGIQFTPKGIDDKSKSYKNAKRKIKKEFKKNKKRNDEKNKEV